MNTTIREKDGGYQAIVSYKQGGKWRQKSKQGFKKQKEAKAWADEIRYTITEDIKDNIDTSNMTVKEALDIYFEYKKNKVKFSTFELEKILYKYLQPLYNIAVSDIKPIQITNIIQENQKRGYVLISLQAKIRTFFNFCIKELKLIRDNPVNIQKKKREDKRIKYINETLYNQILENAPNKYKLLIKILYNTGMRISEVFGLKYEDIQDCIITVSRQKLNGKVTTLKSDNGYRKIPIPHWLYTEIQNVQVRHIDGYVFQNLRIHPYLKKYNVSPHCFRHTFATNLVAKGINLKVASEILGDKFETFINTYVQSSQEEKDKAFKKIIGL